MVGRAGYGIGILIPSIFLSTLCHAGQAARSDAMSAARGWLKEGRLRLGAPITGRADKALSFSGFHVIQLAPRGFVVMSDDNETEPVLAFSQTGVFEVETNSPLWQLLVGDTASRKEGLARAKKQGRADHPALKNAHRAAERWNHLRALDLDGSQLDRQPFVRAMTAFDTGPVTADSASASVTNPVAHIESVDIVDGHIRIRHDAEESVSVFVSYDSGNTWNLLDSGVIWPEWVSKTPAGESMGWFKVQPDGLVDAMTVACLRNPPPPTPSSSDDPVLDTASTSGLLYGQSPSVSDVRVSPLIQSKWNQKTSRGYACYNYYCQPGPDGNVNNYYAGCVATAMAQLMRYWQYPASAYSHTYTYANMPLDPSTTTYSLTKWQAIGRLLRDCGTAVNMNYGSGGSSAYMTDVGPALISNFGYSNAKTMYIYGGIDTTQRNQVLQSNLAGGYPVLLGIRRSGGGHAVVADGFGYTSGTPYYHINMGWGGMDDAWYNLPTVDASYTYTIVDEFIYNVYKTGTGELIAGRVVNPVGAPIQSTTVTVSRQGASYTATTDAKGYYAVKVPAGQTYNVTAAKSGYSSSTLTNVAVGTSSGYTTCGNYLATDFILSSFSFTAVALTNNVVLRWSLPTACGFSNDTVYLRHSTDHYPTNSTDGTEVYSGTNTVFDHFRLDSSGDFTNYYTIWANNGSPYASVGMNNRAAGCPDSGTCSLVWQTTAGNIKCWFLNSDGTKKSGTAVTSSLYPPSVRAVRGVGDVDRDGAVDLILQQSNGVINCWFLNTDGTKRTGLVVSSDLMRPSSWTLCGMGDIDRDGTSDIIWQSSAGNIVYWILNPDGTRRSSGSVTNTLYPPSVRAVRGVGDVDHDGTVDLILQQNNGVINCWFLNTDGTKRTGLVVSSDLMLPSSWTLCGMGDIDRDGTSDIIWQSSAGSIVYWMLNPDGTRRTSGSVTNTLYPPSLRAVRGVGDVDGDGTVDLILQQNNGVINCWFLNTDGTKRSGLVVSSSTCPPASVTLGGMRNEDKDGSSSGTLYR